MSKPVSKEEPATCEPRSRVHARGYVLPFALVHLGAGAALIEGGSALGLLLFAAVFGLQAFGITAGYHRYFSHRSFKTSRGFQLVLATLGTLAVQKGVLWWAANHRRHHRCADATGDPHSPREGLAWSHVGWFLSSEFASTDRWAVRDLAELPELSWLDEHFVVPPLVLALGLVAGFGLTGLLWGFCLSTTVTWHLTYAVNSLGHRFGTRRFATADDSRNSFALALLTFGEGWHNNHHRFPSSVRQGLRWWEIDLTYSLLRTLAALGIVWDLVEPREVIPRGAAR
jgi:stearoyl-CoA desaturase (delta-9 desaturase)